MEKVSCKFPKCERPTAYDMDGYCFSHYHDTIQKAQASVPKAGKKLKGELDAYERSVWGIRNWKEYKW
jgi:hypothetical protein